MKFSWTNLGYFLQLNDIHINKLLDTLTIKGFEIDDIHYNSITKDHIFDIAITANRQDVCSILGFAYELSYILDCKIINTNRIQQYKILKSNLFQTRQIKYFSTIRINKIINIKNHISPEWLINYLKIHDIPSKHLILDIQQYIKIKWGHDLHIFDMTKIFNYNQSNIVNNIIINQKLNYEEIQYNNSTLINVSNSSTNINNKLKYNNVSNQIIILSYIYSDYYNNNIKNSYNTIDNMQGYDEAIHLIATFSKAYISKSYNYNNTIKKQHFRLSIKKNTIKYTLGPIYKTKSKYLTRETISNILNQLKLKPQYHYYNKKFTVTVPTYRLNDLYRTSDIIEEIGRIYGYHNFIDKLPHINRIGKSSNRYKAIKYIRQYFRDIGMHEVINSSLYKNTHNQDNIVSIHNPLLEDQSSLRDNLINHIIQNKVYNYKQKNHNTEFFEIGKIFQNKINIRREEIHIAGIMGNNNFIKQSWNHKPSSLNWFHAKGILEQFFEKIHIRTTWYEINNLNKSQITAFSIKHFDMQNTAYIINNINNEIIGLVGQINKKMYKSINNDELLTIFEFNLNQLINNNNKNSHLSYIFSKYSMYPSVIRDISIKINKNYNINKIKQFIYEINKELIQKVEVFNQYQDIIDISKKCIGIRITYNSNNKTLDQYDLQLIEQNIETIMRTYNSK